jgi:ABC-type uncharacterized transport system involved in gliding motility auxiliary subunit
MERTGSKLMVGAGGLLLALVLFVAVNAISHVVLARARFDLTGDRLYTLTAGTKKVLGALPESVTLTLYFSEPQSAMMPGVSAYAQRVRELLREYERHAAGKVVLRAIQPEPFSEEEDRAVAAGLRGVPVNDGADRLYFGLVGVGSTDERVAIPFFSPEREEFLEYDLTKLVHQVAHPKLPVVGLMTALPMEGGMTAAGGLGRPWAILDQWRQFFDLKVFEANVEAIPADVDVLVLAHPQRLTEGAQYAIDQYVLRGGRLLAFVDPLSESDGTNDLLGGDAGASDLPRLFERLGVAVKRGRVAADLSLAETVRYQSESRAAVAKFPVWMNLPPAQFSREDVVTAELGNMILATAGVIEVKPQDGVTVLPLMETTANAMEMEAAQLQFMEDPTPLLRQYQSGGQKLLLAARVTGKIKTAFPDGKPAVAASAEVGDKADPEKDKGQRPKDKGKTDPTAGPSAAVPATAPGVALPPPSLESRTPDPGPQTPHLAESKDAVNVIVVADADLLADRFWVQVQDILGSRVLLPTSANGTFAVNAVDSLLGSNDLISVRSRGQHARRFDRIADLRRDAELQFRAKEQELMNSLRETESRLAELERGKGGAADTPLLSEESLREIESFRKEKLRIRKELRAVRHQLNLEISGIESWLKLLNIGLVPMLIAAGGIWLGWRQTRRRREARSGPGTRVEGKGTT